MSVKIDNLIRLLVGDALREAENQTGTRIQRERKVANDISLVLDEQEEAEETEETEETEDLFDVEATVSDDPAGDDAPEDVDVSVDVEAEETEETEEVEEPKQPRKMSPPEIAVGTTYKDFKHNFNIIRSAKAISKQVNGETMITKTGVRLREYFNELSGTEKKALQEFMIGLSQVLIIGAQPEKAAHPDIKPAAQKSKAVRTDSAEIEIGTPRPVKVVGSKLEGIVRFSDKNL